MGIGALGFHAEQDSDQGPSQNGSTLPFQDLNQIRSPKLVVLVAWCPEQNPPKRFPGVIPTRQTRNPFGNSLAGL